MKRLKVTAVWFVDMTTDEAKSYIENAEEINIAISEWLEEYLETSHEIVVTSELEEV